MAGTRSLGWTLRWGLYERRFRVFLLCCVVFLHADVCWRLASSSSRLRAACFDALAALSLSLRASLRIGAETANLPRRALGATSRIAPFTPHLMCQLWQFGA